MSLRQVDHRVLTELHKASVLARRPGIVVVSKDAARADAVTGSRARTHQALLRLARSGWTVPVRRDLVVLLGGTGLTTASVAELIDAITPGRYLITAGHALQLRGLADGPSFDTVVLVTQPVGDFSWRRYNAHYLVVAETRIWGGERLSAVAARPGPVVASVERALLDGVAHQRFGLTLARVAAALRLGLERDPDLPTTLAEAARRYGVAAVARRAGLLLELLAGPEAAAPFEELVGSSPTPALLRPGGPSGGEVDRRWRVRINAPLDEVAATA